MTMERNQALLELAQVHGLDLYVHGGRFQWVVACASSESYENLGRFLERTEQIEAALRGLLEFHSRDAQGYEIPRAYWTQGYLEAVETAERVLG